MKIPALRYVSLPVAKNAEAGESDTIKANENYLNQNLNDLLEYIVYLEARLQALGG